MKKITIIIVSAIYVLSIVVVAFLGVLSEVKNVTVPVEKIVLKEMRNVGFGGMLTYPQGTKAADSIYAIFSRPDSNGYVVDDPAAAEITWNVAGLDLDYVIQIRSLEAFFDSARWNQTLGSFDLGAYVLPENATYTDIRYYLDEKEKASEQGISLSEDGVVKFSSPLTEPFFSFIVSISAVDNSNVTCNVRFMVRGAN